MKNILTTQQLRDKHDPDSVLQGIESFYEENLDKLITILSHADSPLLRYSSNLQISFLELNQKQDELINEAASLLKDTLYFMMLSKKQTLAWSRSILSWVRKKLKCRTGSRSKFNRIKIFKARRFVFHYRTSLRIAFKLPSR